MSNDIVKAMIAVLCIQTAVAAPSTPAEVEDVKANDWNLSPCYARPSIALGSPIAAAQNFQISSAPWFPDCRNIADKSAALKCAGCMGAAGVAYYSAISGCTAESFACTVGAWACESVCVATATYLLWAAEQSCYCKHANCADAAVRNRGRIGGPPELSVGGSFFSLPLPAGWGYVGTRSVYITPFGRPYKAIMCRLVNG